MFLKELMNYKIIDNFFDQEDFKKLENINIPEINNDKIKVYHNKILREGIVKINECIERETLKLFHEKYHLKALNILKELFPEKIRLYEFSEFHIIQTGSKYKFPIHDDIPTKLLSGVVYLNPEKNKGTFFFDNKKGENKQIIEWKKNRAVFFSRKERETWHSYEGDGISCRIALVYNLMTSNIKEVCKIEKKNYLISIIRYKINPYLYRFFGFLI